MAASEKLHPVRMQEGSWKNAFDMKTPGGFSQSNTLFLDPDQG